MLIQEDGAPQLAVGLLVHTVLLTDGGNPVSPAKAGVQYKGQTRASAAHGHDEAKDMALNMDGYEL
jgi:hypothetical protein